PSLDSPAAADPQTERHLPASQGLNPPGRRRSYLATLRPAIATDRPGRLAFSRRSLRVPLLGFPRATTTTPSWAGLRPGRSSLPPDPSRTADGVPRAPPCRG